MSNKITIDDLRKKRFQYIDTNHFFFSYLDKVENKDGVDWLTYIWEGLNNKYPGYTTNTYSIRNRKFIMNHD